jgi:phosphoserine phosphatase
MNVYDFDGTIIYPNCTLGFAFWCLKRYPKLWFTYIPKTAKNLILYKTGKIPGYLFLRRFFSFLGMIDDLDEQIELYWDKNEKHISAWYLKQKRPDDLIISASPSCIVEPIAKRLGVNFMATEYDCEYGVFTNNLMYAKEKSRYIIDHGFPVIENFYSDSLSDTPLALCAEKAYLVKNKASVVTDWPDLDPDTMNKVKKQIDTGWSLHLNDF